MLQSRTPNRGRRSAASSPCVQRYLYPEPRLRLGALLGRNRAATACMDLSDGLADAVHQIAEASGVGAMIDGGALPIEPGARRWFEPAAATRWTQRSPAATTTSCCSPRGRGCAAAWRPPSATATRR